MPKILLTISLAVVMAFATSAQAASNVTVTLKVAAGHYKIATSTCTVSVPELSDGLVVLETARTSGCIRSYEVTYHPSFGPYVSCINGLCGVPGTYWAMRENCIYTDYGVGGFAANQGDELSFTYESWGHFLLPQPC